MGSNELLELKSEALKLKNLLIASKSVHVEEVLNSLSSVFDEIDGMSVHSRVGRLGLMRFFLETDLSDDAELLSCYSRFSNLCEVV